jgi:hypothetical protein
MNSIINNKKVILLIVGYFITLSFLYGAQQPTPMVGDMPMLPTMTTPSAIVSPEVAQNPMVNTVPSSIPSLPQAPTPLELLPTPTPTPTPMEPKRIDFSITGTPTPQTPVVTMPAAMEPIKQSMPIAEATQPTKIQDTSKEKESIAEQLIVINNRLENLEARTTQLLEEKRQKEHAQPSSSSLADVINRLERLETKVSAIEQRSGTSAPQPKEAMTTIPAAILREEQKPAIEEKAVLEPEEQPSWAPSDGGEGDNDLKDIDFEDSESNVPTQKSAAISDDEDDYNDYKSL